MDGNSANCFSSKSSFSSTESCVCSATWIRTKVFISIESIPHRTAYFVDRLRSNEWLFEIKQHVDKMLVGVGAQPMPDGVVVDRQFSVDLCQVRMQLSKKFFKNRFIKDSARRDRPHLMKTTLGRERKSRQYHGVVVVLRTISNSYSVGNGVRLIVVGSDGINLYIEVASMSVFFPGTVPACFDLHTVGDIAWFQ